MLFNSYIFIFLFFPVCLIGYYSLLHFGKKGLAQLFLVGMSFWFYAYFQINYLLIMIFSIACNYFFHCVLSHNISRPAAKGILLLAVAVNLGILFYFKYYDFFVENCNAVLGTSFLLKHVILPLGISFFTFQQIGFLVDTYRGEIKNCKLLPYVLFVAFFPQLVAGPIVSQSEMLPQFDNMTKMSFNWERFSRGFILFILGMFKKVILADTFGAGVDYGYANIELLGRMDAVLLLAFYSLQLYFDFSGYCDMARGIGGMLGVEIPVNFHSPYQAVNIVDFWKRWHITLSRFFTRYVYIPLGGNRKGEGRMYLKFLIVFFLSGLWHGAGWNFIVWGMMHGVLYVVTRWWQNHYGNKMTHVSKSKVMTILSRACLFCYVSIAWVYFRAENVARANSLLSVVWKGKMQKLSMPLAECFQMDELWYVLKVLHLDAMAYSRYILMFIILAVGIYLAMFGKNAAQIADKVKAKTIPAVLLGAVFVWCILSLSQVSTFLYFNF